LKLKVRQTLWKIRANGNKLFTQDEFAFRQAFNPLFVLLHRQLFAATLYSVARRDRAFQWHLLLRAPQEWRRHLELGAKKRVFFDIPFLLLLTSLDAFISNLQTSRNKLCRIVCLQIVLTEIYHHQEQLPNTTTLSYLSCTKDSSVIPKLRDDMHGDDLDLTLYYQFGI
jgi:hypothetical protein